MASLCILCKRTTRKCAKTYSTCCCEIDKAYMPGF